MSQTSTVITSPTLVLSTRDKNKCSKCDKALKNKDKVIQCGACKEIFHPKCQAISDAKYQLLTAEGEDTLWLCTSCNKTTRGLIEHLGSVEQRVAALEVAIDCKADKEEIKKLQQSKADKSDMKKLDERLSHIEQNSQELDLETEEFSKKLEEKLKEQQAIIQQNAKSKETSIPDAVKELEDRERRRPNLIFHNLKESTESTPEARKLDDATRIKQICKDHLKTDLQIQIDVNGQPLAIRLGKFEENKTRSVKVIAVKGEAQKILNKAKDLNNSTDADVKKIIVKPDLTPMQRKEEAKLVNEKNEKNKEAKEKNEPEDWIIQRWKVVRRKKPKPTQETSEEEFKDAAE